MNFGKENISADNHKEIINDSDLKILKKQLEEAIKNEDYEQATVLRNLIDSGNNFETLTVKTGIDSPERRALEGIQEKRQEKFFEGKEIVEASQLFYYLDILKKGDKNDKKVQDALRRLTEGPEETKELEQIDRFLNLRNYQEEAIRLVNLSKEKFDSIWQPYRQKVGLLGEEYNEYKTSYNNSESTIEQWKELRKVPDDLAKPLYYWQKVYDNSRVILDRLNEAINKMEGKISGY